MKKFISILLFLVSFTSLVFSQSVIGTWKNIDDEDGKVKSHLEVYEEDGLVYAKVLELLDNASLQVCSECKGERKDADIEGMVIMWDMKPEKKKNKFKGGKILDPKNGKTYSCKIELKKPDLLKVRGYIKAPIFGRTQEWYRVK